VTKSRQGRARYYTLPPAGRKQPADEIDQYRRVNVAIARVLGIA
jgi:hypothetical protein